MLVKGQGSKPPDRSQRTSKARRGNALNTPFVQEDRAVFQRMSYGAGNRILVEFRRHRYRKARKIGIYSGDVTGKEADLWQRQEWLCIFSRKQLRRSNRNIGDNCASKTEFIEKAVKFYIGYLNEEDNINYLSPMITETVKAQIKGTEQRLARLLFKVAVELGKLSHMTAAVNEVDDETLNSLHAMCVNEVRRINGIIDYEDAAEYQNS